MTAGAPVGRGVVPCNAITWHEVRWAALKYCGRRTARGRASYLCAAIVSAAVQKTVEQVYSTYKVA